MRDVRASTFAAYVADTCAGLLADCACALGTTVRVLGVQGETLLTAGDDVSGNDAAHARTRSGASAATMRVPIESAGTRLGELIATPSRPGLEALLRSLAAHIAERFACEQDLDHMTQQLGQAYDEINLFYRFTRLLDPDRSFANNATDLLIETAELLDPRLLICHHFDGGPFAWSSSLGRERTRALQWVTQTPENRAVVQRALQHWLAQGSVSSERLAGALLSPHGLVDYVVVPVRTRAAVTGFVGLFRGEEEAPFETGEVRLLECLAKEISNTATHRRLHQELSEMLFHTVRGLVAAIDAKDEYTRGHSERVHHVSILIAKRLGLSAEEIRRVSWAAMLHDVGKIAIGRSILHKPGKLTDDEYETIKTHPVRGCRVLEPIPQLREILPGIRHHHERWDGRGYPDGLRGEEIPLTSRIIAIADTFDAIVSTRAYREARSLEFALEEIGRNAGIQFDAQIVPVFLALAAENAFAALNPASQTPATAVLDPLSAPEAEDERTAA